IIVGTWLDLTEILKSWKSSFSSSRTSSSAASTSASAWSFWASPERCLGSEPELAPIRIGIPAFRAAFTTSSTLSGPPMLPGVMRTAATPDSIAFSASEALKWMSAITGIGESRTIRLSASASSVFGTAQRTTSQPADASSAICATVASTSCVFVSVIDWTTTGAPPPIVTPPTEIWRIEAIELSLTGAVAAEVVLERDDRDDQDQGEADDRDAFVDLAGHGAPADPLDRGEQDVPAVEGEERQEVEERQREADERQ